MKEQEIRELAKEKGIISSHNKSIDKIIKELADMEVEVELEEVAETEVVEPNEEIIEPVIEIPKKKKRKTGVSISECEELQKNKWEVVGILSENGGRKITYTLEKEIG